MVYSLIDAVAVFWFGFRWWVSWWLVSAVLLFMFGFVIVNVVWNVLFSCCVIDVFTF